VSGSEILKPPEKLGRLLIPEYALRHTITGLAYGAGREMLCYWLGSEICTPDDLPTAVITTVAFPQIESGYAFFKLREGQMGLITSWCAKHSLWVLAQVHTHPTDEPHSQTDECWPASHRPGFLSLVIPFFASMSSVRNPGWRVYESQGGGIWRQCVPEQKIQVIPDVWFSAAQEQK
jgi:hypothetical protein